MKILNPGHKYSLQDYPPHSEQKISRDFFPQEIQFVKTSGTEPLPGIISQELVLLLIDRFEYLNHQNPSRNFNEILIHLRQIQYTLNWLAIKENVILI